MTAPTSMPTTALLASVDPETLQAIIEREDEGLTPRVLVRGEGAYHAIVDYEPGEAHDERHIEAARALSVRCDGPVYVVSFCEGDERVTTCQRGAVVADLQYDETPDLEKLARRLGLGRMFPKPLVYRSFMFVENASIDAVEAAISQVLKRAGRVLRLEARGPSVLGWIEDGALGTFPEVVSKKLGTRVFHSIERPQSFAVLAIERGKLLGIFEEPRTTFSRGFDPLDAILGETTRDGILRAMGVDDAMNR